MMWNFPPLVEIELKACFLVYVFFERSFFLLVKFHVCGFCLVTVCANIKGV